MHIRKSARHGFVSKALRNVTAAALTVAMSLSMLGIKPVLSQAKELDTTWNIEKSKTAKWLEEGKTAQIDLQVPSSEAQLSSDIVFVVDNSSCKDEAIKGALNTLDKLVAEVKGAEQVKVGVVSFKGDGKVEEDLSALNAGSLDAFKTAIQTGYTGTIKSGTNMHDGLLKAKDMLDSDSATPANRKYMILVSDGLTRLFTGSDGKVKDIYYQYTYSDPESQKSASDSDFDLKSFVYFGMIDEWKQMRTPESAGFAMPFGSWNAYYTQLQKWVAADGDTYARDFEKYGNDATTKVKDPATGKIIDDDFAFIKHEPQVKHAMAVDRAVYEAYNTYQQMVMEGYHCFAVRTGSDSDFSKKFMNELNNGKTGISFSEIADNILYTCGTGTKITDSMGKGDNYNFDFQVGSAVLTVGDTQLTANNKGKNTWEFVDPDTAKLRYTLTYDAASDLITLTSHENISNFAPVHLTYRVNLKQAPTQPGNYTLATNTRATLVPTDSTGVVRIAEDFEVPTLPFTVAAPTPEPEPEPQPKPTPKPAPKPQTKTKVKRIKKKALPQTGDDARVLPIAGTIVGAAAVAVALSMKVRKTNN